MSESKARQGPSTQTRTQSADEIAYSAWLSKYKVNIRQEIDQLDNCSERWRVNYCRGNRKAQRLLEHFPRCCEVDPQYRLETIKQMDYPARFIWLSGLDRKRIRHEERLDELMSRFQGNEVPSTETEHHQDI